MKTKRKMIIAISAFAMVILAGVVAVVAVLAASNVTVNSSLTIKYTVGNVAVDVSVGNKKASASSTTAIAEKDFAAKKAVFGLNGYDSDGSDSGYTSTKSEEAALAFGQIPLEKDECLVLMFKFENSGDIKLKATLTPPATSSDVEVRYGVSSTPSEITATSPSVVSIPGGADQSATYYVKLSIAESAKTKDVEYTPNFSWLVELDRTTT